MEQVNARTGKNRMQDCGSGCPASCRRAVFSYTTTMVRPYRRHPEKSLGWKVAIGSGRQGYRLRPGRCPCTQLQPHMTIANSLWRITRRLPRIFQDFFSSYPDLPTRSFPKMSESKLSPEVIDHICQAIDTASDELRRLNLEVNSHHITRMQTG